MDPIFFAIGRGDLEAVKQLVRADAAVLEGYNRWGDDAEFRLTPLMYAITVKKPAIALWLIQHRGQHNLETADASSYTALHHASESGPLNVVQALVAAGANTVALDEDGATPLISATVGRRTDIVAFLLRLPPVKASINTIDRYKWTALSIASSHGDEATVQRLLDAGADPTIPAGTDSPFNQAVSRGHDAVALLLRRAINEAKRAREGVAWLGMANNGSMPEDILRNVRGNLVHPWADQGAAGVLEKPRVEGEEEVSGYCAVM
jgi:ankyrin repeat protein